MYFVILFVIIMMVNKINTSFFHTRVRNFVSSLISGITWNFKYTQYSLKIFDDLIYVRLMNKWSILLKDKAKLSFE